MFTFEFYKFKKKSLRRLSFIYFFTEIREGVLTDKRDVISPHLLVDCEGLRLDTA